MAAIQTIQRLKRHLNVLTHQLRSVPMVVLMPHSRCNARCLMCDIWKANANKQELSEADLLPHLKSFEQLGVQRVVLSGGEALMHSNLWRLAELLVERGIKLTLLSTGLTLAQHAKEAARWLDEITVSLDGSPKIHNQIRNIPRAYERLREGVQAVKRHEPGLRITGRSVVQRQNFFDLPGIVEAAEAAGLDQISFLPVDVSSQAFNRLQIWGQDRVSETALSPDEVERLAEVVERTIEQHTQRFISGFIAESPKKLRRLPRYFAAVNGHGEFPETFCNAPWVSAVIEADGAVRPCFFHPAFGHIQDGSLQQTLNTAQAIDFRRGLDVKRDPICRRCVCTLELPPSAEL